MAKRPVKEDHVVRPTWQPVVAIVVVALVACLAGIGNELAQDDIYLILQNTNAHSVANIGAMFTSPYWPPPFQPDLYRPLTSLLLTVQYQIGSGSPTVFHFVSYALYAAVCVNVFLLARRLMSAGIALGISLLFAAHPVHVEAVALSVGQSELVVALIALIMVQRYLVRRAAGALTLRDWIGLSLWYAIASLFKEQGLVLPGLLVGAELLLVADREPVRFKRLIPGFAVLAVVAVVILAARRAVLGDVSGTFVAEALVGVPIGGRFLTMLRVVVAWMRLLVWPAHLQADYTAQEIIASTGLGAIEAFGALLLIAFLGTAWFLRRRAPIYTFAVLWCAIALFPVSNIIVPTAIVLAERTLFLPSIGFVLGVGALLSMSIERLPDRAPRAFAAACALLMMAGLGRSVERQTVWRDDAFLAVRTVQDAPRSYRAQRVFGDVAFDVGQPETAAQAYARALELAPEAQRWRVHNDIARTLRRVGESRSEVNHLQASLATQPNQEDTRGYLIAAELTLGRYEDAARQADTALTRGGTAAVFSGLRRLADSAEKAGAPPGSVHVAINTGAVRRGP